MRKRVIGVGCVVAAAAAAMWGSRVVADQDIDWGLTVQKDLNDRSVQLFGVGKPLDESAIGPFAGSAVNSLEVADHLSVSLVSTAGHPNADQIAMWPDDVNPTHLFMCIESGTASPGVQRVNLAQPPGSNVTTVLTGLQSCDPIRRTPWGSIIAAEETSNGGVYEIMDPINVSNVTVSNRATGANNDPQGRVVKRQKLGQLSFEGNPVQPDGTIIFGDELGPSNGTIGGGIYKFVPVVPYIGFGQILTPSGSPLANGTLYGLRVGSNNDYGQGAEIGQGVWVQINQAPDANGNIDLRTAQAALKFTGYYRPEDSDIDPIALEDGLIRVCWANTGRVSQGAGSVVETGAIWGEVMCLTDTQNAAAVSGKTPRVTRFLAGNPQFHMFDNVAFQPVTGRVAFTEDPGTLDAIQEDGTVKKIGDDILMCLPDGADDDVQSDGCIRIASVRDTTAEPTGIIFTGDGQSMYVSIQHRGTNEGAILRIDGFDVKQHGKGK